MIQLQQYDIITGETIHALTKNVNNPADGQIVDLGEKHEYRYVEITGISNPTGTQSVSYTTNGNRTVDVKNYENISINVNVPNVEHYNALYYDISDNFGTGKEIFSKVTPFSIIDRVVVIARIPNSVNYFFEMLYTSNNNSKWYYYQRNGSGTMASASCDIGTVSSSGNCYLNIVGGTVYCKIAISYPSTEIYMLVYGH